MDRHRRIRDRVAVVRGGVSDPANGLQRRADPPRDPDRGAADRARSVAWLGPRPPPRSEHGRSSAGRLPAWCPSSCSSASPASASRSRGASDARPAPVPAAPHGPDRVRPLLQRRPRPGDRLRDRHPPGEPRGDGRGRVPPADLPTRPRRGHEPLRGGPPALGVPAAVADADPRDHPGHAGERGADPDGLRGRPG